MADTTQKPSAPSSSAPGSRPPASCSHRRGTWNDDTREFIRSEYRGGVLRRVRPFATAPLRIESHGFLARELLLALRRGLPLDDALETFGLPEFQTPRRFWNLLLFLFFVLVIFTGWFLGPVGVILLILLFFVTPLLSLGSSMVSEGYRSFVSRTLARELRRGKSLAAAFRAHPELFDSYETTLMEAGERSGRLDLALEGLASRSEATEKLAHTANMAIYPAFLAFFTMCFVLFIGNTVLTRYQDILNQFSYSDHNLVAERLLDLLLSFNFILQPHLINWTLAALLLIALLTVLPRAWFNGSPLAAGALMAFFFNCIFWSLILLLANIFKPFEGHARFDNAGFYFFCAAALAIPLSGAGAWSVFRLARYLSGRGTDSLLKALSFLPLLRGAERRLAQSRFLFALEALLRATTPWPEALVLAGEATGRRRWIAATRAAAERARQGQGPAEIFRSLACMPPATRSALSIADFGGHLLETLRSEALTSHSHGHRLLTRFNAIFYPLLHVFLGALVGVIAWLLYLPLISLPLMVPFSLF